MIASVANFSNRSWEPLRNVAELTKFLLFTGELLACGDTDAVIHYSQLLNAMALKYWIEYFRSLKGTCSGTLFWEFDDPLADCPDGYLYPSHMLHRHVSSAQDDLLLHPACLRGCAIAFIEQLDGGIALTACNELTEGFDAQIEVSRRSFDGSVLAQQRLDCHLPGNASSACWVSRSQPAPIPARSICWPA